MEYCNYSPSIIIRWRYLLVVVDAGAVMGLGDGVSVLDLLILLCIITSVILFFFLARSRSVANAMCPNSDATSRPPFTVILPTVLVAPDYSLLSVL